MNVGRGRGFEARGKNVVVSGSVSPPISQRKLWKKGVQVLLSVYRVRFLLMPWSVFGLFMSEVGSRVWALLCVAKVESSSEATQCQQQLKWRDDPGKRPRVQPVLGAGCQNVSTILLVWRRRDTHVVAWWWCADAGLAPWADDERGLAWGVG